MLCPLQWKSVLCLQLGFLCSRVLFLCSLCIFLGITRILELAYGKSFDFYYFIREGLEKQMNLGI